MKNQKAGLALSQFSNISQQTLVNVDLGKSLEIHGRYFQPNTVGGEVDFEKNLDAPNSTSLLSFENWRVISGCECPPKTFTDFWRRTITESKDMSIGGKRAVLTRIDYRADPENVVKKQKKLEIVIW